LDFSLDNFSGTARPLHHKLSQKFFTTLLENGFISTKSNDQFYCEDCKRYLADRYVEGTCPYCKSENARGDQCDDCGKLIETTKLIDPKCKMCGNTPVIRNTKHWFLDLPKFQNDLMKWLDGKSYWKPNVINFIKNWIESGLLERAVTRDLDWGVPVPLENAIGKVLYVWLDAPIGYISATMELSEKLGKPDLWKEYWQDDKAKVVHFIGKDNIPFHTIIWPATLMGQKSNWNLPENVPANEYLNLEGKQLSTSRNWAIWVNDFLKDFESDYLRYILAVNAPETKDSDFTWKDFQAHINNDLNNVLGNLANRTLVFAKNKFDGKIEQPARISEKVQTIFAEVNTLVEKIEKSFFNYEVRKATKLIFDIARIGNKYFDESKPWVTIKSEINEAKETIWACAELLRIISVVASPILVKSMIKLREMLNIQDECKWENINNRISSTNIRSVKPLFRKIDDKEIDAQMQKLEENATTKTEKLVIKPEIEYEDFMKMDFRIGKVIKAEKVKKSNRLLKLKVKIGSETKTVMSGIAKSYSPDEMIGKSLLLLINLKPRKIMGVLSEAMILAAENGEKLAMVIPDKKVTIGSIVS